jgi:hypothetical protein
MPPKKIFILSMLILTIGSFFGFGFYHLSQFKTADEHYWMQERTPQYWNALKEGRFKKMLINDKPGITVALVSGVGLLWESNPVQYLTKVDDDLKVYDTHKSERVNFLFRLPILLFNSLFLLFLFWVIRKATRNAWIALWSVILTAFSPILIGISQIVNPDSLLWVFSTGAIFSYFALLQTKEKKFILLTALFSGLAILSKYTADILFPFFFFFMLAYYLIEIPPDEKKIKAFFFSQIPNFFLIILGALGTVTFFIPAILIKPVYLYRLTLGFGPMKSISIVILIFSALIMLDQFFPKKSCLLFCKKNYTRLSWIIKSIPALMTIIFFYLLVGRNILPDWKLFDIVPFDAKEFGYIKNYSVDFWEKIILQFNPLVFSLPLMTLFLVVFLWLRTTLKKNAEHLFFTFSITCFILVYYLAYIFMDTLAIVRYSILIYPLLSFLSALALWQLQLSFKRYGQKIQIIFTFLILFLSLNSLYLAKPFYFNYTNALLPQENIISDAWGYGGYEAAQYLNALPQSKELTIWSDYYGVCEFFVGKCITDYTLVTGKYTIDYYVLTRRGEIRYRQGQSKWELPEGIKVLPYYENSQPIWKLNINNRPQNFIKIIKSISFEN